MRQSILRQALTLVSHHSFTRNTLLHSIPSAIPFEKHESLLDTLFGSGQGGERALVEEWEKKGLEEMRDTYKGRVKLAEAPGKEGIDAKMERVRSGLASRLHYSSSTAGEHLVQAHALLSSPNGIPSINIPTPIHSLVSTITSSLRLPIPYLPPGQSRQRLSSVVDQNGDEIPRFGEDYVKVPMVNPLPILRYGMRIADEALFVGKGEEEGGGTDWYVRRLAIGLIYLHAESHLLQPRPINTISVSTNTTDPFLAAALTQLDASLNRYRGFAKGNEQVKSGERQLGQYFSFVGNSMKGLIKSRGWIG